MKNLDKALKLGALASLGLFALTGCGEYPQVVQYKSGSYQGKSDTRPWEGGQFAGNKQAWENALTNRAQNQNEYKRVQ